MLPVQKLAIGCKWAFLWVLLGVGEAIGLTGVSRNTLKLHFRVLVERGHLNRRGSGRGVWYELR